MIYGNIADLAPPEETLCPRVSDLANRDLWINLTNSAEFPFLLREEGDG